MDLHRYAVIGSGSWIYRSLHTDLEPDADPDPEGKNRPEKKLEQSSHRKYWILCLFLVTFQFIIGTGS